MNYSSNSLQVLINLTNVIGYYVVPILAGFGALLNLACLVLFFQKKFDQKERLKFMIMKCFFDFLGCLNVTNFQNNLCVAHWDFYPLNSKTYRELFCLKKGLNEIMFTYDRLLLIRNKKNWFNNKITFKYLVIVNLIVGLLLWSPALASHLIDDIVINGTDLGFYLDTTLFGASTFYAFYMIIMNIGYDLCTAIAVGTLSIMLIIDYRKFMRSPIRQANVNQQRANRKSESDFTKMTLILGLIHVLTRPLHLTAIFFNSYTLVAS